MSDQREFVSQKLKSTLIRVQAGQIQEGLDAIAEIRRNFEIARAPDIAARVICVEGICYHYSGNLKKSVEKFRLAMALAIQYGAIQTKLFTMGWMALGNYNSGNYLGAIDLLGEAAHEISLAEPDVRFRIASLLTMLHAFSGDDQSLEVWFSIAREEALRCGEKSMMSALIYNVASLRVANAIVRFLTDLDLQPNHGLSTELLFLRSAENYDFLVGVSNQIALHGLLQGQCLCLLGDYSRAAERFQMFLDSECRTRASEFAKASFGKVWCQLQLGSEVSDSSRLPELTSLLTDKDDLSYANFVLSRFFESTGNLSAAKRHAEAFRVYRDDFLSHRCLVLNALRSDKIVLLMRAWPCR